jgi:antitoxin HicB
MKKQIEKIASEYYSYKVERLESGEYYLSIPDLPGCYALGSSLEEAETALEEAKKDWIFAAVSNGVPIPVPSAPSFNKTYSGQVLLRMPKGLHRMLVEAANEDGISLNQYMVFLLTEGLTKKTTARQLIKENYKMFQMNWENKRQDHLKKVPKSYLDSYEKHVLETKDRLSGKQEYEYKTA